MATDTFVQVQHHADLRSDFHNVFLEVGLQAAFYGRPQRNYWLWVRRVAGCLKTSLRIDYRQQHAVCFAVVQRAVRLP